MSLVEKKKEFRFCVTFNPNDPLHRTAVRILNEQGRHKAQFLVNAINNYIMEGKGRNEILLPDRAYVEDICKESLSVTPSPESETDRDVVSYSC